MTDIDEIRRKRMQQIQQQAAQQQSSKPRNNRNRCAGRLETQKRQAMMQLLTPEARARLANIRLTKPEFVDQIEIQLIQLAQAGRVQSKITDEQLKELLRKLIGQKRDIKISRSY